MAFDLLKKYDIRTTMRKGQAPIHSPPQCLLSLHISSFHLPWILRWARAMAQCSIMLFDLHVNIERFLCASHSLSSFSHLHKQRITDSGFSCTAPPRSLGHISLRSWRVLLATVKYAWCHGIKISSKISHKKIACRPITMSDCGD